MSKLTSVIRSSKSISDFTESANSPYSKLAQKASKEFNNSKTVEVITNALKNMDDGMDEQEAIYNELAYLSHVTDRIVIDNMTRFFKNNGIGD